MLLYAGPLAIAADSTLWITCQENISASLLAFHNDCTPPIRTVHEAAARFDAEAHHIGLLQLLNPPLTGQDACFGGGCTSVAA